jgi:hypothetical protein
MKSIFKESGIFLGCLRVVLAITACTLLLVGSSLASGGGQGNQALGDVNYNARYSLSSATSLYFDTFREGKCLDVTFTDSSSNQVLAIYVTFQYDTTKIKIDSIDTQTAHGYYDFSSADSIRTKRGPGWYMVSIMGFDCAHFTNSKIFGLWVSSDCLEPLSSQTITIADGQNHPAGAASEFELCGGGVIYPGIRNNGVVALVNDISAVFFTYGTAESTYVSGQVKVPLQFFANFSPRDSLSATITYDTLHLHYDSVSSVGAWMTSGLSIYHNKDTIKVGKGDNTATAPYMQTLVFAYLFFTTTNSCELGGQYDLDIENAYAYACPGYGGPPLYQYSTHIGIWKYLAAFEMDHITNGRNLYVLQPVRLQNNFPVLPLFGEYMSTPGIAFHFKQVTTSHATFQYPQREEAVTGGTIFWAHGSPGSGGKTIKTDEDGEFIPFTYAVSASTFQILAHIKWRTTSTDGTDSTRLETIDSTDTYLKPAPEEANLPIIRAKNHDNIAFMSGAVTVQQSSGCPLLFAWDGSRFAEENTIAGDAAEGALAKPAPDYYRLVTNLSARNGNYLLQIREAEKEESNFDNFELTVVDHPQGTIANVSKSGDIEVYRGELIPVSAVDDAGVDHAAKLFEEDGKFYAATESGSLTLTYLPGKNFNGESVALVDNPPPPLEKEYEGGWDEEMRRKISVVELLPPTPTVITEILSPAGDWIKLEYAKNRAMDYTDVPTFSLADYDHDGQIVIRKSWDANYCVDKVSILLPYNEAFPQTKLNLVAATHSQHGDILNQVTLPDDDMATLIPGESIELQFADPDDQPVRPGYVRDFIFSANGFYTSYKGNVEVPEAYRLLQNYPNPFNPSTTIYYNLITTTNVDLAVYNTLGQKVKTLVNAMQQAGDQSVVWDGTDDSGIPVASGIYLYKLTTPDYTASRKMILMK